MLLRVPGEARGQDKSKVTDDIRQLRANAMQGSLSGGPAGQVCSVWDSCLRPNALLRGDRIGQNLMPLRWGESGLRSHYPRGLSCDVSSCVRLCTKPAHFGLQLRLANRVVQGTKQAVRGVRIKNNCTICDASSQGPFRRAVSRTRWAGQQGTPGLGFPLPPEGRTVGWHTANI